MAEFDAELYLRLAGERSLLDRRPGGGEPEDAALDNAAHAFVAVGAMTAGAAQAIVDDYDLASAYRTGEHSHYHHRRLQRAARRATQGPGLTALRAVPCHRLIEQSWGHLFLRYAVLSDEVTVLYVTMRPAGPPAGRSRSAAYRGRPAGRARPGPRGAAARRLGLGLPPQVTVGDDRGTTSTGSFSGGGSDSEWRGQFEVRPPLAPDTAWIDVSGERIELPGPSSGRPEVRVEPGPDGEPAHGYLWVRLASLAEFQSAGAMETTIEALVAAGVLAAGDPTIADVRAVANGLFAQAGSIPGLRAALPEPWRSVLARRGQGGGPCGLVVVGATTPPCDGITVAVLAVRSEDERFTADVEVVPALAHRHWSDDAVDVPLVAWWAMDDRGQHYLGHQGEWHSGPDRSGGQIEFWPALDPAAQILDIMPTTMAGRTVIQVPLEWGEEL